MVLDIISQDAQIRHGKILRVLNNAVGQIVRK